jgi:hypothetical protein
LASASSNGLGENGLCIDESINNKLECVAVTDTLNDLETDDSLKQSSDGVLDETTMVSTTNSAPLSIEKDMPLKRGSTSVKAASR